MGQLGLAFSLGIMAGPMIGGVVTEKFGDRMVAFTASALSVFSVIIVQLFLPKNTKSKIKKETAVSGTLYIIPMISFTCTVFLATYRNTSGSLGEQEMLWEHKS